jgi:hypothetical protein
VLVVDTGPLVATADRGDKDHAAWREYECLLRCGHAFGGQVLGHVVDDQTYV